MSVMDIIEPHRAKRLAGVKPNYELIHHCPQCGSDFYCPDRYINPTCGPIEYCKTHNMTVGSDWTCLPCIASLSSEERVAWYEAHGVDDPHPEEQAA